MRRRVAAAFLAALALASPARALLVKPAVKQTLGSRHYASTYGSVDVGDSLHFKPSFSAYHSDDATGTYKTYGLKASYDTDLYTYALLAGFSPRVNGYANHYAGGEVTRYFDFEKMSGHDTVVSRLELTGAITQTQHSDEFQGSYAQNGRFVGSRLSTTTVAVGQTDFEGTLALEALDARLELDVTKSVYNKDVARVGARSAQVAFLSGLSGTLQAFPDVNVNARLDLERWDAVTPWVSYTYTAYKVQQRPSAAYALGLDAEPLEGLGLSLSYQRLAQSGQADRGYYNVQASYRFE